MNCRNKTRVVRLLRLISYSKYRYLKNIVCNLPLQLLIFVSWTEKTSVPLRIPSGLDDVDLEQTKCFMLTCYTNTDDMSNSAHYLCYDLFIIVMRSVHVYKVNTNVIRMLTFTLLNK